MPPQLEVETIEAEDIDKSCKGEEREKRHKFLLKWKGIKGSKATYRQLITALLKMKCGEEAEKVCKVLKESLPPKLIVQPLPSNTITASPHDSTGNWALVERREHGKRGERAREERR